jgi:hypothetical protein
VCPFLSPHQGTKLRNSGPCRPSARLKFECCSMQHPGHGGNFGKSVEGLPGLQRGPKTKPPRPTDSSFQSDFQFQFGHGHQLTGWVVTPVAMPSLEGGRCGSRPRRPERGPRRISGRDAIWPRLHRRGSSWDSLVRQDIIAVPTSDSEGYVSLTSEGEHRAGGGRAPDPPHRIRRGGFQSAQ